MKWIFKGNKKLKVVLASVAMLVGGPALLPYVPAITLFLETMTGQ